MEQKWYTNILMSISRLLKEAEASTTNISVARNIKILKRLLVYSESDKIATVEALVAYHTARHGQRFHANDCLSTLLKNICDQNFFSTY
jgi:acetyl-CoA carboxylase alpha subunit